MFFSFPGSPIACPANQQSFELITGHVYSASAIDTLATIPETIQLTDCLANCLKEPGCQSLNFETGLCVLFNSTATSPDPESPTLDSGVLKPSQFPVFTIYAQKVCLSEEARSKCPGRIWTFERVLGYELRKFSKKVTSAESRLKCSEDCLLEKEFDCRSFNYNVRTKSCILNEMDRHTISQPGSSTSNRYFRPAEVQGTDYYESNCVRDPNKLCDFKAIKGKMIKTVDSVYQGVDSDAECRRLCLEASYRCFSYDLGDPAYKVCRTSHLNSASSTHINEAYFEAPDVVTYELASCYNGEFDQRFETIY